MHHLPPPGSSPIPPDQKTKLPTPSGTDLAGTAQSGPYLALASNRALGSGTASTSTAPQRGYSGTPDSHCFTETFRGLAVYTAPLPQGGGVPSSPTPGSGLPHTLPASAWHWPCLPAS